MNEFEKKKCIDLTNKMYKMDLCRPFKEKVDPLRDGAPDYFQIVKRPMDLSTIRRKLNNSDYKSIDTWATDVNQVWTNAKLYNNEGTLIYIMAQEMENWFFHKFEKMPRNKDEEWMHILQKTTKKLYDLSKNPPSTIISIRPSINFNSVIQSTDVSNVSDQGNANEIANDSQISINSIELNSDRKISEAIQLDNNHLHEDNNLSDHQLNQNTPSRSQSPAPRPLSTPPASSQSPKRHSRSQQSTDEGEKGDEIDDS